MSQPDRVVTGDLAYPDTIRRRGARSTEEAWFVEAVPFMVPGGSAVDHPVSMTLPIQERGDLPPGDTLFRHGPSGLLVDRVSTSGHGQERRYSAVTPNAGSTFPMGHHWSGYDPEGDRAYTAARILASGREAALAAATDAASRCVHVDGVLLRPTAQPSIVVDTRRYELARVHYTMPEHLIRASYPFHVSDLDDAMAHAAWKVGHPWHPWLTSPGMQVAPAPTGAVIASPPDRGDFAMETAPRILGAIAGTRFHDDFSCLPVPILDRWLAFRRAAETALAGPDPSAVTAAYEALVDIRYRLPEMTRDRIQRTATSMEMLATVLEEPVRHWDSYLSRIMPAPTHAEDLESVGLLAR